MIEPSPRGNPVVSPAGYLRGLRALLGQTATSNLQRDPDDPYDPAEDAPWSVTEGSDNAE